MTSYSRKVIPGRNGEASEDLDKAVFGGANAQGSVPAANDAADDEDDDPPPIRDRRTRRRRKDDFLPLAKDAMRPAPDKNGKSTLIIAGVMIVTVVFGVVVWNAYDQGVRPEDAAATPEIADAGPFKAKPFAQPKPDTGVAQAEVFERIETPPKPAAAKPVAHNPEARETPPVAAATPAPAPVKPAVVTPPAAATPAPAPQKVVAATPAPATPAPATKPVAAAPAPANPAPAVVAAPKPAAAAPAPAPAPAAPAPGAYTPAFAASGTYVVQIAAPSTEEAAQAEWSRKAKAMPELFGAAEKIIVRADVNGKTVYRVRAGSFATTADAEAFCSAIKAKGGQCFRAAK